MNLPEMLVLLRIVKKNIKFVAILTTAKIGKSLSAKNYIVSYLTSMRKHTYNIILFFALFAFATAEINATVYCVKSGGTGVGTSWSDAYGDLQDAIDGAIAGDTILVAEGTYKPSRIPAGYFPPHSDQMSYAYYLKHGIVILGGFPNSGTPAITDRDPYVHTTILSGDGVFPSDRSDNLYHVLFLNGTPSEVDTTVIDGFTVSGGNANVSPAASQSGGGIYISTNVNPFIHAPLIMRNMIFKDNFSTQKGGAVYAAGSNIIIENSVFRNNKSNAGGAIHLDDGGYPNVLNINNCQFIEDSATRVNAFKF
ncbi:MAG: hypothetical protein LBQ31_09635 [Bacteroidales bacterium]|jgi:predicted outer membrane repeat protein|nr:hypothetical protein [Bacteroidales bacterium]